MIIPQEKLLLSLKLRVFASVVSAGIVTYVSHYYIARSTTSPDRFHIGHVMLNGMLGLPVIDPEWDASKMKDNPDGIDFCRRVTATVRPYISDPSAQYEVILGCFKDTSTRGWPIRTRGRQAYLEILEIGPRDDTVCRTFMLDEYEVRSQQPLRFIANFAIFLLTCWIMLMIGEYAYRKLRGHKRGSFPVILVDS